MCRICNQLTMFDDRGRLPTHHPGHGITRYLTACCGQHSSYPVVVVVLLFSCHSKKLKFCILFLIETRLFIVNV